MPPDPPEPRPFGTRDATKSTFNFATALLSRYYSFFATVCIETKKKCNNNETNNKIRGSIYGKYDQENLINMQCIIRSKNSVM